MSERSAVQNPMLKYAEEIGWEYVRPTDALSFRSGDTGLYFTGILEAQLVRLNPGIVDASRTGDIIRRLNLLRPTLDGNHEAHLWLRGEQSVFVPEEKRERNIRLIDFEHPENNLFHVTDEWWQKSTVFRNRADVVFSSTAFRWHLLKRRMRENRMACRSELTKSDAITERRRRCLSPLRFSR